MSAFYHTRLFCYVMKHTEVIIPCAFCPIMHLTQQWLCEPEVIILFDLVVTFNLKLPYSAVVY